MGSICDKSPDEYTNEIEEAVGESIVTLPPAYMNERKHIVEKMRQAAPRSHENLLYSDYPDKNGSKVDELALKNITSNDAKKQMAKKINEKIQPKVDEKTADMNPIAAAALRKAVEKAVEESVDKAVEAFIKNIDKIDTSAKLEV